jgi:hypothetical protein
MKRRGGSDRLWAVSRRPPTTEIGRKADIVSGLIPMSTLDRKGRCLQEAKRGTGAAGPLSYLKIMTRQTFVRNGC